MTSHRLVRIAGARSLLATCLSAAILAGALSSAAVDAAPPSDSTPPSLFAPAPQVSVENPTTPPQKSAAIAPIAAADAPQPYTMRLDVAIPEGGDLEAAYYNYLSENRVHPKVLRAKVRRVMNDASNPRRLDEVIAILRCALRTGQVQPWMYEALGLAMRMNKMPAEEIERTLMSAADFTTSADELVHLADFMDRMGLQTRALALLRESVARSPGHTEAYPLALQLAKDVKDDEAILWAAIGILRQEWLADQRHVPDEARRAAVAALARLRNAGRSDTADQLARDLKDALVRDVIVKVAWVGQADVDLTVMEPGGTVCSYRAPRTGNGGVLVGDTNSKLDRSAGGGYSELYACPEGFSGTYRVVMRQIWGRIPGGKVEVDVWAHQGTDHAVRVHKVISLDENGAALVAFDLDKGRRQGSVEGAQLASDVQNHLSINRAVLAQQLNAISSPQALAAQQIANQSQQPFVIGATPVFDGPNQVGFKPEVILLPIGATMSAAAVISADRRYVRITALPFFSNVLSVSQFNLIGGEFSSDLDTDGALDADGGDNPNP